MITVIIPTLNSEKFINKCIDSILNQSYKKIQIIIVDGGSIDNTEKFCKAYSDERLKFIVSVGAPQGEARNTGLKIASTEYITFIDSDDYYLNLDFFCQILSLKLDPETNIISTSINFINYDNSVIKQIGVNKDFYLRGFDVFIDGMLEKNFYTIPWNKIYKRQFLLDNGIFFPDAKEQEDTLFSRYCAYKANCVYFSNIKSVNALIRGDSRSRNMQPETILSMISVYASLENFLDKSKINADLIYLARAKSLAYVMLLGSCRIRNFSCFLNLYENIEKLNYFKVKNNHFYDFLPIKNKFLIYLCNYRLSFYLTRLVNRFIRVGY